MAYFGTVKTIALVSVLIFASDCLAKYTTEHRVFEGLSHNMIRALTMDSEGVLWLSTEDGLNYYDGYRAYKVDFAKEGVIVPRGPVQRLYPLDRQHFLMRTTPAGNSIYNKLYDEFFDFKQQIKSQAIYHIAVEAGFEILLVLHKGVYLYKKEDRSVDQIISASRIGLPLAAGFINKNQIWISTETNIYLYDLLAEKLIDLHTYHYKRGWSNVYRISDRQLFVGTEFETLILDIRQQKSAQSVRDIRLCSDSNDSEADQWLISYIETASFIYSSYRCGIGLFNKNTHQLSLITSKHWNQKHQRLFTVNENQNKVLFLSSTGLWTIDLAKKQLSKIINKQLSILESPGLASLVSNSPNAYFVTNPERGVLLVSDKRSEFDNFSARDLKLDQIKTRALLVDDKGKLWVATQEQGISILSEKGKLKSQSKELKDFKHIRGVIQLEEDSIWVVSETSGVYEFKIKENRWVDYSKAFPSDILLGGYKDLQGRLWIHHSKGVSLKEGGSFKHYSLFPDGDYLGHVRAITQDKQGVMWFGSHLKGLYRFDEDNASWTIYRHDEKDQDSISHDFVFTLLSDKKKRLWVGTWGGGLDYFDEANKKFIHFTTQDGLPSNVIYGILEDENGYLWFSTAKGLVQFKPCEDSKGFVTKSCPPFVRIFDRRDGLIIDEFDADSYYKAENGDMYFGGIGGFIRFNPEKDIRFNDIPPKNIIFTVFSVNGQKQHPSNSPYIDKAINYVEEIHLSHDDILIKFDFAALDYLIPEKNQYKYRLNGGSWHHLGNDHSVTFAELEPGKYEFEVLASNNDNVWMEKAKKVKIIVSPPWYQSFYAYVFYLLGLVTFILLYVRFKEKNLRSINLRLEETVSERTKQLAEALDDKQRMFENLSHEFRTPLTLILGPIDKLLRQSAAKNLDIEQINKALTSIKNQGDKLLYLVEQLLALAEVHAHKHNRIQLEIGTLTRSVIDGLKILAEEKSVKLQLFNLDKPLTIELAENAWETILTNLVTNAIKHSPKNSCITIRLRNNEKNIILSVSDQGEGIMDSEKEKVFQRFYKSPNNSKQGSGIGLALTKELVESLQGTIALHSEHNSGCEFRVTIPYQEVVAQPTYRDDAEVVRSTSENQVFNNDWVLLVEDEEELRDYTRSVLEEKFRVETAANGREALKHLERGIPQLIVSDVMMPEMDGFEFAKRVKQSDEFKHIPLILLTAKNDIQSQKIGYQAKVDDYIGKPFSSEILLMKAANLVDSFNAYREHIKKHFYQQQFNIEQIEDKDKVFLEKLNQVLSHCFTESPLKISNLAEKLNMDKRSLARYTERLLSQSPGQVLKEYRLTRAMEMLKKGYTVTQSCFDCGFSSVAYFSSCFKQRFNKTPSSILEALQK